jgi:Tfp pilus assembly protein PilN
LLSERTNTVDNLTNLDDVLPSGATVERLDIQGKNIDIEGRLTELSQVAELESKVLKIRKNGDYKELNLGSLSKRDNGWPFQLEVVRR